MPTIHYDTDRTVPGQHISAFSGPHVINWAANTLEGRQDVYSINMATGISERSAEETDVRGVIKSERYPSFVSLLT